MKFFLKIALPWALSLVTAFCLGGLFFVEYDDSATPSGFNDEVEKKSPASPMDRHGIPFR